MAETEGPDAALAIVDRLDLGDWHLVHAVRGDLLERLGRAAEAAEALGRAAELAGTATERQYLAGRRGAVGSAPA